jgi:aspartyl-tRNA(Asn)/glutamyl-tRNA(Gln) amidotransferase subunit C
MGKLSKDDVLKLASLSRLALTEDELQAFVDEISEILQYVQQLQSVDVTDIRPTNQVTGLTNVMREDAVIDYGYRASDMLKNVPQTEDNQLKVKRMIA